VCCNTACAGQCEACDVAGKSGTCSPVSGKPHGTRTNCDLFGTTCGATCNGTLTTACTYAAASTVCSAASCSAGKLTAAAYCTGSGVCPTASTSDCGAYTCDTTAKCRSTCTVGTAATDCAAGYGCKDGLCVTNGELGTLCDNDSVCKSGHCTASTTDKKVCCTDATCPTGFVCAGKAAGATAGTCVWKENGKGCSGATDCASGYCVDGLCCEGLCNGQCEACDIPGALGRCEVVNGKPHGTRPACADGGSSPCKSLSCAGSKDRTKCTSFAGPEVECAPSTCTGVTETEAAVCDGAGSCGTPKPRSCGAYACGTKGCKTSCTADTDCSPGNACDVTKAICGPARPTCSTDRLASIPADKTAAKPCSPYLCNNSTGDCFQFCATSDDCAPGNACDAARCVPTGAPADSGDGGGCGCRTNPAGRSGSLAIAGVLGMLGAAVRRRRR